MTTPNGAQPPGSTPDGYGVSWGDYAEKTQDDWQAQQTAEWNDASQRVLAPFGDYIQNLPTLVVVQMLHMLADLLDMIPFVGDTLESLVDGIADSINTTYTRTTTITTGVTSNITGATPSPNPIVVGDAVAVLNATVQSSSQPPQTVIVTSTQNVNIPTGCRVVVMNIFGGGAGGARGGTAGGSGLAGGAGGVGGWQKDMAIQASSLPVTLRCVVGLGGNGGTSDGQYGGAGGTSKVCNIGETVTYLQATGGQGGQPMASIPSSNLTMYNGAPGNGNGIATLNGQTAGGYGGWYGGGGIPAANGANGSNVSGGLGGGGINGTDGQNGSSDTSTLTPGMGGSGGGGGASGVTGSGHRGGDGGFPGGAGGGGGQFWSFGSNGNGGNGAPGEIWLTFVF